MDKPDYKKALQKVFDATLDPKLKREWVEQMFKDPSSFEKLSAVARSYCFDSLLPQIPSDFSHKE